MTATQLTTTATTLPLELPAWPDDADVAVSLTFDVDAESGWLGENDSYRNRLTTLSEGRFGVVRGLPRILGLLRDYSVSATFYVPGTTADRHPVAVEAIVAAGHDVGHHGHLHLRSDRITADAQRREIELGLEALERIGVRPAGYRSASWELTPETFALLGEYEFRFDSSCMGDDRPYLECYGGASILEFPVHWSLDDWPYFIWTSDAGGNLTAPDAFLATWIAEFESAVSDRRHMTLTMHPEVIGRGYRMTALRRLIDAMSERARVHFTTHTALADKLRQADVGR
jgi:peptidoglycan-N-acetylglucosamine deacetylase